MFKVFFTLTFITLIVGAVASLVFLGTIRRYSNEEGPIVEVVEKAIAVGASGSQLQVRVSDPAPGLDQVVVRMRQRRSDRQLFKSKLHGATEQELLIPIPADKELVEEGQAEIEVVAFDRGFWSNRGSTTIKAFVDTRPPKLEVLSTQHNLRQGGSQVIFYRSSDENLKFSGVRVGDLYFKGYPASELDSSLQGTDVYAALYTVPMGTSFSPADIRAIAVDVGGNSVEQAFYNKVFKRTYRSLRPSNPKLLNWVVTAFDGGTSKPTLPALALESSAKEAALDASSLTKSFRRVPGTSVLNFADIVEAGSAMPYKGQAFVFMGLSDVQALHPGEVQSVRALKDGSTEVVIGHGLGLSTAYSGLKNVILEAGVQIQEGQVLGAVGNYVGVEARVSGVPVDLTEWWSQEWLGAHIVDKIDDLKKTLGLTAS